MPDAREFWGKYLPVIKQNWLPLALGLFGLILFIYGLIALLGSASNKNDLTFESAKSASDSAKTNAQNIIVDVEGAVVKPGIYSLNQGSRVQDALILALGLSEKADRNWVEKNLNLAAKLSDGVKIYIPRLGETNPPVGGSSMDVVKGVSSGTDVIDSTALININNASAGELDTLPGVGPVTAQKIIDNRPYTAIDELLSKKSVNSKVFSQIKDKVSVN